jgi:hypothetical protein
MNPMNTFNPEVPCHVHDKLNDELIEWQAQWAPLYRDHGVLYDEGVIAWDGLLLDGWSPVVGLGGIKMSGVKDREPRKSEDEIQREQLGPRGIPGKESPAKMTPQREKKTPTPAIRPNKPSATEH